MYGKVFLNHILRGVEKIPGINLQQVLSVGDKKFLLVPKVGTRLIRDTLLKLHGLDKGDEWRYIEYHTKKSLAVVLKEESLYVVTRDPFERLHSCWKQKIFKYRDPSIFSYFWMYYPLIKRDMTFENFLKAVYQIPVRLSEKHFRPVSLLVDLKSPNVKIVRLEELSELLGLDTRPNSTPKIEASPSARSFFDTYLAKRYAGDIDE